MSSSRDVLLLTGSPGSGKTSVARLLAGKAGRAAHIESDHFFHLIVAGYIDPWKPESHEQNTTVMAIVGEAAVRLATAGYWTVVDGIVIPGRFFEPLRDRLRASGLQVAYAILRPPLSVALERAAARSEAPLRDVAAVEQLWHAFSNLGPLERHVIDVAEHQSLERTAELVAERLREGALTVSA